MESESSMACSQQPATGSYPNHVNLVNSLLPYYFFKISFNVAVLVAYFLEICLPEHCMHYSHSYYIRCPYHPPWFYPSNIWQEQRIKWLIIQFFPPLSYFNTPRSKHSLEQHPVLKHTEVRNLAIR